MQHYEDKSVKSTVQYLVPLFYVLFYRAGENG